MRLFSVQQNSGLKNGTPLAKEFLKHRLIENARRVGRIMQRSATASGLLLVPGNAYVKPRAAKRSVCQSLSASGWRVSLALANRHTLALRKGSD